MASSFGLRGLWALAGLALAMVVVAILTMVDYATSGDPDARGATFGFLFFAALLGIPAGVGLLRARARAQSERLRALIVGFARTRDSISPAELGRKLALTELEAETMLVGLIEAGTLDLVFHRSRDEYIHRERIAVSHRFFDRCNSCGATLRSQVVFADETMHCEYCNKPIELGGPN